MIKGCPAALRRAGLAAALLLSGCALLVPPRAPLRGEAIELDATPFFPQQVHQCGPAALATLLVADGAEVTPETLSDQVYVPGREGSFQVEMIAAARRNGRVPLLVAPTLPALMSSLDAGKPVLVLQNVGLGFAPAWHYAVVVGYDPQGDEIVLRSGGERRLRTSAKAFERTWRLAGYWGVTISRPDRIPATATMAEWIGAAAPFESLHRLDIATRAYEAAVARWPQEVLPRQALANARYAAGDRRGAEEALRAALAIQPDAATRNNLASVLLDRGCVAAARREIEAVTDVPADVAADVAETLAAIGQAGEGKAEPSGCE